jgi:2-polyprenyl-6-hydroxyphenyl methylase/3-demethylubiquinone-9 3-methyltransferase
MIWLLENVLQEIPRGIHDWNKFIKPQDLTTLMHSQGFSGIEIKGFNIFGESLYQNLLAYIHYKKTGNFQVEISNKTSVMYIGKAVKQPK